MREFDLAWHYFLQALKSRMAYRWDFLMQCVAALAADATGLIVVLVLFYQKTSLGEWNKYEVLFIYGVAMLAQAVFGMVSHSFWQFASRYIMKGELDRMLTRPVNPLLQIVLENLEFEEIPSFFLGIGIVAWSSHQLGLELGIMEWGLLLLFVLGSGLMLIGVFLALTTTSFWFEDRVGIAPPVFNLMAFGKYPLTIFHKGVQVFLSFIIPFGFIAFYPSMLFLDNESSSQFTYHAWCTPVVGLGVFALSYWIWLNGMKFYRSTGT